MISGLKLELVEKQTEANSEWVVIFGAAGAVGSFAVQIAKLCGYKVLAACPNENIEVLPQIRQSKS